LDTVEWAGHNDNPDPWFISACSNFLRAWYPMAFIMPLAKSNLFSELEKVIGNFGFVAVKLSPVAPVWVL
jgi:hypothetical protein